MKYKIKHKNYDSVDSFFVLEELLKDRGIENPKQWLTPDTDAEISPWQLSDMAKAVSLLHQEIQEEEGEVVVVVDSDVDGYTSAAIISIFLGNVLEGKRMSFVIHDNKQHGIDMGKISAGSTLVIVPDAGSSQFKEQQQLIDMGKKVIILDHHAMETPPMIKNSNLAIVNNQLADYPNPGLSGAGVALKFVQAYCFKYGLRMPLKLYALAACGIVADVMNLRFVENRYIVLKGLEYLNEHPFLKELLLENVVRSEEDTPPSLKDIGWTIGPSINAVIRMGTAEQKETVLGALINPLKKVPSTKNTDEGVKIPLYEEAARICKNAKVRQKNTMSRGLEKIKVNQENVHISPNFICFVDTENILSFELSGLIANMMVNEYRRPVFLLKPFNKDGEEQYRGSVRAPSNLANSNLREVVSNTTGAIYALGHASAFGVGVKVDNFKEFLLDLDEQLNKLDIAESIYEIDLQTQYTKIHKSIIEIFADDTIWGQGVEKPLVLLEGVPLVDYNIMGEEQQHVKFHISVRDFDAVFFNQRELVEKVLELEKNNEISKYRLDIIGEFGYNVFNGVSSLQFVGKSYELVNAGTSSFIFDTIF